MIATPTGTADDVDRTWKTGDPAVHTTGVDFRCVIPRSVVAGGTLHPAESGIFGHGLLGLYDQVTDTIKFTNSLANTNNSVWCATSWAGFSTDDLGQVITTLNDVSNFSKLSDRMIQGFVNMIYLGRAMVNPGGLSTDPAFSVDPDGGGSEVAGSAINPAKGLYWEGISQGAIMGGALTALEPDLTQSVLDVTGMNYSTLLRRSADSAQYFELHNLGLYDNYPNQQERPLLLSLMQLLWDRGEADGYAQHMTSDPLPNTPPHHVLLQLAYGDHQVSNLAAETEARTIGAQVETPALDPGRHWDVNPFLGIPAISSLSVLGLGGDGLLRRWADRIRWRPGLHRRAREPAARDRSRAVGGAGAQPGQRLWVRPTLLPASIAGRRHAGGRLAAAERVHRPVQDCRGRAAVLLERIHRAGALAQRPRVLAMMPRWISEVPP